MTSTAHTTLRPSGRAGIPRALWLFFLVALAAPQLSARPIFHPSSGAVAGAEGSSGLVPTSTEPVSPLQLVANVPAHRLDAYLRGERVASWPVTVGSPRNPTPTGRFELGKVIWNPWWHPPAHRRPKDRVTPPGPRNPMGRVKLHFTDLYYFHGTALVNEIGRPTSRGCIRLANEDAIALARLVNEHAGRPLSEVELESLVASPRRTRNIRLPVAVPVTLAYQLTEVRDGALHVHSDIYRQVGRPLSELALEALATVGIPSDDVDRAAIAAALEGARPLVIPVDQLLVTERTAVRWIPERPDPGRSGSRTGGR
jgi:hypothetical protein